MSSDVQEKIRAECDSIRDMLLAKNKAYGNSALEPLRIFSKASADEQIKVRLDDKLSRIARGEGVETEDVEADIIGYLVLMRVFRSMQAEAPLAIGRVDNVPEERLPELLEHLAAEATFSDVGLCEDETLVAGRLLRRVAGVLRAYVRNANAPVEVRVFEDEPEVPEPESREARLARLRSRRDELIRQARRVTMPADKAALFSTAANVAAEIDTLEAE